MKNILELNHQPTNCKIAFCYGEKAYSKYLKKVYLINNELDTSATCLELTHNTFGFSLVLGVKYFKNINIYEIKALIVHEISHAVSFIMEYYNFNCDEFRSYTFQWLYIEIMPFLDNLLEQNNGNQ